MSFDFDNNTPIYLQIIEYIKRQIITGEYKPNEKIPSVREFSLQFEVNPNTVQKALSELERLGLIYTERTNGKFVTDNSKIIDDVRKESIRSVIDDFYESMLSFGIDRKQVVEILKEKE